MHRARSRADGRSSCLRREDTGLNCDTPSTYHLTNNDLQGLETIVRELRNGALSPDLPAFYDQAWQLYGRIPGGLRKFLDTFRRTEPSAAAIVTGFPADDSAVGPTPENWQKATQCRRTVDQELYLALTGIALGEPFMWSTLQGGRMVHNVIPIHGEESQQSGHGSDVLLEWHTEDGFHPYRCDYLVLFGVRNSDRVPTTLASMRDVELTLSQVQLLSERRFFILPDDEHLRQLAASDPDHPGLKRMRAMRKHPEPVAVLFGSPHAPYLRIDPFFMRCADGDKETESALRAIIEGLERVQQDVVVDAGSLLIVDNYLAVHGRRAFTARYDGTDRWLKKLIVTRDLRKSRDQRRQPEDRVLY
ncbi:MAG: guanitoxin biosynthesis L-enduracididine beta-hydroxylase GntD [Pseudonocardiales bacterium]